MYSQRIIIPPHKISISSHQIVMKSITYECSWRKDMGNTREALKILIIGAGSIGKRHAQNCAVLGADVSIHDHEC